MLRELLVALDAMPDKELIRGDLVTEQGDCCAIGALLVHRSFPSAHEIDPEDSYHIAQVLDVAEPLVQEVEWVNDEGYHFVTNAERWAKMRAWVVSRLKEGE